MAQQPADSTEAVQATLEAPDGLVEAFPQTDGDSMPPASATRMRIASRVVKPDETTRATVLIDDA